MSTITTGNFAKALWPGVNSWYGDSYKQYSVEYSDFFTKESSDKAYEEDVFTSGFGLAPVKLEGEAIQYDSSRQLWVNRSTHVTYGMGFAITREMVEDDQYEKFGKKRSQALAFSMRQTKENVAANVAYNRGFNSSYTFGDGKELYSTAHPLDGGTFSNMPSANTDLCETALEQAVIDISGYVDARGLKISIKPKRLVIPANYWAEAERILKSEQQNDTNLNAINALRSAKIFPGGYAINHYITDTDSWYILTDCPTQPIYYERRGDEFAPVENDFDTENARFKATGRYSFTVPDPRAVYGCAGA